MPPLVKVKDFLGKPAPPGYIPGVGRGASGFTTRSDLGTADEPGMDPLLAATGEDERFDDNEEGLFSNQETAYDNADDEDADRVYASIDAAMAEPGKAKREQKDRLQSLKNTLSVAKPKIQEQFADLKRELAQVSEDEWASIPEVGDYRAKRVKKSTANAFMERFTPVPDSLILAGQNSTAMNTSIEPTNGATSSVADLKGFGEVREKMLGYKIDQVSASSTSSGDKTVDPSGYLTALNSVDIKTSTEIGDIQKARHLLKNLTTTNPKHAPGWISLAQVEEAAGKLHVARNIIAKACEVCPESEDVWLQAALLYKPMQAKKILATAVQHVPKSIKIWMQASKLESDTKEKKAILRKALEFVPDSMRLWKAAIELEEDPEDAKIMLAAAVEYIPYSVELWLALARLETKNRAKQVLNKARKNCPLSSEIWIAAAKLEETNDNEKMVETIVKRGVQTLLQAGAKMDREAWLKEAEACEESGNILTCQAIVRSTIALGLEEEDYETTWTEDAEQCLARKHIHTARAIFAHALSIMPNDEGIWQQAAFMERNHGSKDEMEALLEKAVVAVPEAQILWLMWAKERWLAGDVPGARAVLQAAFQANTNSEDIWLAAFKLESENGQVDRARLLLGKAMEMADTPRVWMKSAVFERQQGAFDKAMVIIEKAIEKFPLYPKLYMIKAQLHEKAGEIDLAAQVYKEGLKKCPTSSAHLWILAAKLEINRKAFIIARSILERGRANIAKNADLWLASIRLEIQADNKNLAKTLMARALQECPKSGLLWAESIFMEPRQQRKSKGTDALKRTDYDPWIMNAIARLFWQERMIEKARSWFGKSVASEEGKLIGDFYIYWFDFETKHGSLETQKHVIDLAIKNEPRYGELWISLAKDDMNRTKSVSDILHLSPSILK